MATSGNILAQEVEMIQAGQFRGGGPHAGNRRRRRGGRGRGGRGGGGRGGRGGVCPPTDGVSPTEIPSPVLSPTEQPLVRDEGLFLRRPDSKTVEVWRQNRDGTICFVCYLSSLMRSWFRRVSCPCCGIASRELGEGDLIPETEFVEARIVVDEGRTMILNRDCGWYSLPQFLIQHNVRF